MAKATLPTTTPTPATRPVGDSHARPEASERAVRAARGDRPELTDGSIRPPVVRGTPHRPLVLEGPATSSEHPIDAPPPTDPSHPMPQLGVQPDSSDPGLLLADEITAVRAGLERALVHVDRGDQRRLLPTLAELHRVVDLAHAALTLVQACAEADRTSERLAGLPLSDITAMSTRTVAGERRALTTATRALGRMPNLQEALREGVVGWSQVRSILAASSRLSGQHRAELDEAFADRARIGRFGADELTDAVWRAVDERTRERADEDRVRAVESRFLSLKPLDGGSLSLYGELDAESAAIVLEAIEGASPPLRDTRHDVGADPIGASVTAADLTGCDGIPAPLTSSLGHRRADALVRLAESYLAGHRPESGRPGAHHTTRRRRSRPRIHVMTDLATLLGDDERARSGRVLWASFGTRPSLTPRAVRRLASDADLQFILHDAGEILGVAAPTPVIPGRVRTGVQARDQHCRFPECSAPLPWCDLHHVVGRAQGGHTTVGNLVALCRRHHTSVTEGRWRLTMTSDGTVTVRRGQRCHTSDPPLHRVLRE
jgi:hypothetical protein